MRDEAGGHLKQACRVTGAAWAALIGSEDGSPLVLSAHGLTSAKAGVLKEYLSRGPGRDWIQALDRKTSSLSVPAFARERLGVRRIWGFALPGGRILLVGAEAMPRTTLETWGLIAQLMGGAMDNGPVVDGMFRTDEAYDRQQALDSILGNFMAGREDDSGWLAIRHGEQIIIAAMRNLEGADTPILDLNGNPLLERMRRSRSVAVARKGSKGWADLPHAAPPTARFWAGFPLVVGDRLIGAVAIFGRKPPSPGQIQDLTTLARQIAQQVDLVVSLQEVTSQLRRLATLNEFALAISSAEQLPQVAERVLAHLGALFPAHKIVLYVPSLEGTLMQEFRSEAARFSGRTANLATHPLAGWFAESADSGMLPGAGQPAAGTPPFTIPLRYREATVGVLTLEGSGEPELSRYDQSMLAVVASYMAGVVERGRLRSEAVERARRLEQTVQQLQQAEMTAGARLAAQQAAESRLVQAAKLVAVGEMAAGVAHELNNPLTTVTGFAELILDETPSDASYRADLEMVLHEARRARSVVRRLLDFARQGDHLRARADINEIVEDVLALMTHFVHTSGVQLEVELTPGLPWINLDSNQIKQVLLNLLHNALHAMPGGGRLQIRTSLAHNKERDWVVIQVTDNGMGIEASELDRIFEPFYTTRADSGGTGLGLAVTYGIVADHGGTIEVQSQRGAGSTFSVWLPV